MWVYFWLPNLFHWTLSVSMLLSFWLLWLYKKSWSQVMLPLYICFSFTAYKIVLAIVLGVSLLPLSSRFILFFFPLLCENVSGPLNIFLLPACTVLSFVDRECWRDMAGDFCFLVLVCLLCGLQQHAHLLQSQPTELPSACTRPPEVRREPW